MVRLWYGERRGWKLKIKHAKIRLEDMGVSFSTRTLRRKIDRYLPEVDRNQHNGYRDVSEVDFMRLSVALGLERRGLSPDLIIETLDGKMEKEELDLNLDSAYKMDDFLRSWLEK